MTSTGFVTRGLLMGAAGFLLIYTGFSTYRASKERICSVCDRLIHQGARTVASVDGREEEFCCPACALTDHLQTGKEVKIISFTDYETGDSLDPERAWLVRGSDVNVCLSEHVLMGEHKEANAMEFDRCSPSILAFSRIEAARDFIKIHGGTLQNTPQLLDRGQ